jgi:hypothetical protein
VIVVSARFEHFDEVRLTDLIGAIGVYVIWDSLSVVRPTYIGEGNILKRLSDHVSRRFGFPWSGYIAVIEPASSIQVMKNEAKAVEHLLLEVGVHTRRSPKKNSHPGARSMIDEWCKREQVRVNVSGFDPYVNPRTGRRLERTKRIKIHRDGAIEHDWRALA